MGRRTTPASTSLRFLPPVDLDERTDGLLNADQGEHTERMARNVLCMVGLHHWVRLRNEDGEEYTECSRCGTYNVTPQEGGTLPPG